MNAHRIPRIWYPWLVLSCSLWLAVLAAYYVHYRAEAEDQLRFQNSYNTIHYNIQDGLETHLALLRGGAGLFSVNENVTRADFRAFVERLGLRERYPGMQGIGFLLRSSAAEKDALLARVRQEQPGFQIKPEGARAEYHPVIYIEPLDERNQAALGYDMFTEPVRRAAMERARDTGFATASGKVTLIQEIYDDKQAGFLIYVPVYQRGRPVTTEVERRAALRGFVYGPLRMGDLLRGILHNEHSWGLGFAVYDEAVRPENLLYRSFAEGGYRPRQQAVTTIEIAGRPWSVVFTSRPEFDRASNRNQAFYLLLAGGLFGLALFGVGQAQVRTRLKAERAAQELLASQSALGESEERYRTITETASDVILTIDQESRIVFVNRAVEKVFGQPAEELLGQRLTTLMPEQLRDNHLSGFERYLRTGVKQLTWASIEVPGLHRDGHEIPLEVSFGEFWRGGRRYFTGVMRDISERKRVEQDLQAAHQALQEVNAALEERVAERTAQLSAVNQELARSNRELQDFAFVASHDLQEPLRKIQAFGDLLKSDYGTKLDDEGRDFIARMQNAAQRMNTLITDLLTYSRVTTKTQPFAPVDLNQVAGEVLDDLETRLKQTGGRVETGALPTLEADSLQMRQLLQNLIGNALKFHRKGAPPIVQLASECTDGFCQITVADNGVGFDEKYLDRIFTPFQRLHARGEYEGTGMGLAVCRKIVERHGGTLTARSSPGAGSTFIINLPVTQTVKSEK